VWQGIVGLQENFTGDHFLVLAFNYISIQHIMHHQSAIEGIAEYRQ
jgi:hypothetical protein